MEPESVARLMSLMPKKEPNEREKERNRWNFDKASPPKR
jgi:hypothetical protein